MQGQSERSYRTTATNDQSVLDQMESVGGKSSLRSKYMTWGKRVDIALKKGEELLFASMHMMVQENEMRIKYSLIGVLIDFLQVFAFTLSQDFGWGPEYDSVASVLLMPARLITWTIFQVFFWLAVFVAVSAFGVSYYVGYSFITSDFRVMWPIHYLRTIVNMMLSVLFIPTMTVFMLPLKSDAQGYLPQFADEGIRAWGDQATFYGVVSIIVLVIFIPYCLMMGLLNFEFAPNTKDIMSRHTSWLDFIYLIMKTLIVMVTNATSTTEAAINFRVVMLLVPTLFVAVFVVFYCPYYKPWVNTFRGALFGMLLGASINTAIRVFSPKNPFEGFGLALEFVLHVIISLLVGAGVGVTVHMRMRQKLKERGNLYLWVAKAKGAKRALTPQPIGLASHKRQSSENSSPGIALSEIHHRKSSTAQSSQARRSVVKSKAQIVVEEKPGMMKRLWTAFQCFNFTVMAQLRVTFLQEGENDDLNTLAETVFQRCLDHKPISGLFIIYGNFLVNYKRDWLAASAQVKKARAKGVGFFQRWLCYMVEKKIERERRAYSAGMVGSTDLMAYVEFQHLFHKAQRFHLEGLRALRHFWESVYLNKGDKQLEKMTLARGELMATQQKALMSYSRLISSNANSVLVWRSYGSFLADVADEKEEAQSVFQLADDIEERQAASRGRKTKAMTEGSFDDSRSMKSLKATGEITIMSGLSEELTDETFNTTTTKKTDKHHHHHHNEKEDHDDAGSDSSVTSSSQVTGSQSHTTGNSSKKNSTNSSLRNAFDDFGNSKAITRLHQRFVQAFCVLFMLFLANYVATTILVQTEDKNLEAFNEIYDLLLFKVLSSVTTQELVIDYFYNGTMTQGVTQWKILPEGRDGHLALLTELLNELDGHVKNLYGHSVEMGQEVKDAWEQEAQVIVWTNGVPKFGSMSIKDALDSYRATALNLATDAAYLTKPADDLMYSDDFPYFMINSEEGFGGVIDGLIEAYKTELKDANELIQYIILGLLIGASLIAIGLLLFIIQPTMKEVHLDDHISEALLTYIPNREVEKIVRKVFRSEREMMKQLLDSGDGSGDEEDLEVFQEQKKKSAKKEKQRQMLKRNRQQEDEVNLHNSAVRQMKRCKQQRPLRLRYYVALTLIMALLAGNCAEMMTALAGDVESAQMVALAGQRLDVTAVVFSYIYYIPDATGHLWDNWESKWREDFVENANLLAEINNALLYGSEKRHVPNAFLTSSESQPTLSKQLGEEVSSFLVDMRALQKVNGSTSDYTLPEYWQAQRYWDQPGIMKGHMEESRAKYYSNLLSSHTVLSANSILWLIAQILALVVAYFAVVRFIVFQLRENIETTERLIKMIPKNVLVDVTILTDYLRDKVAFLEKVKEKAKAHRNAGELDESWASASLQTSSESVVVVSMNDDILHANDTAAMTLGLSANELHHEKIDVIVAPAYRTLVKQLMKDAVKKGVQTLDSFMGLRSVMRKRERVQEQFCASLTLQYVVTRGDPVVVFTLREVKDEKSTARSSEMSSQKKESSHIWEVVYGSVPAMIVSVTGHIVEINHPALALLKATFSSDEEKNHDQDLNAKRGKQSPKKEDTELEGMPETQSGSVALARGMNWDALFSEASRHDSRLLLREALSSSSSVAHRDLKLKVAQVGGHERIVRVRMEITAFEESQESRCFVAVLEDITHLRSVQESVQFASMLSKAVITTHPMACLVTDQNGVLLQFNESASVLWGYDQQASVGQQAAFLFQERDALAHVQEQKWTQVMGQASDGTFVRLEILKKSVNSTASHKTVTVIYARECAAVATSEVNPENHVIQSPTTPAVSPSSSAFKVELAH